MSRWIASQTALWGQYTRSWTLASEVLCGITVGLQIVTVDSLPANSSKIDPSIIIFRVDYAILFFGRGLMTQVQGINSAKLVILNKRWRTV